MPLHLPFRPARKDMQDKLNIRQVVGAAVGATDRRPRSSIIDRTLACHTESPCNVTLHGYECEHVTCSV